MDSDETLKCTFELKTTGPISHLKLDLIRNRASPLIQVLGYKGIFQIFWSCVDLGHILKRIGYVGPKCS